MPYIEIKTTAELTAKNKTSMKEKLGRDIALIPGKSESYLMLCFEGGLDMYFKGDNKPCAFAQVMIFGKSDKKNYEKLTAAITETIHSELGVEPDRVYVKYEECEHWGCNGVNF